MPSPRVSLLWLLLFSGLLAPAFPSLAQLTVSVNGNVINWSAGAGYCCVGASLDEPFMGGAQCSSTTCSTLGNRGSSFSCNSVGTHVVTACWYSAGVPMQCESQSVEVTEQAPPTCPLFDMVVGTQVLTHKIESGDSYPFGQTADAQTTIRLKARRANPGTTIYLRVVDPAGSAAYGTPHAPDDNADQTANVGTFSGSKTTSVTLPSSGSVPVVLTTTGYAAGDNYEVRASADPGLSTDPNFVCDATQGCRTSPVITAWKRVYLETDRMFRRGSMLAQNAQPGATMLSLTDVSMYTGRKGQTPGSSIVLVHAARAGIPARVEPSGTEAPITVESVDRRSNTITLSRPILGTYLKADTAAQPWLGDGVAIVTGNDATDFYTPNTSFLQNLMAQSFVELQTATKTAGDCGCIPYYANFTAPNANDLRDIGDRWHSHQGEANHFYLAGANLGGADLGVRIVGTRNTYVFVGKVNSYSFINKDNFNGEVAAHEFSHTWDVNGLGGHCTKNDYANASLKCLMRSGNDWVVNGSPATEYYDGRVMFHFDSTLPPGTSGISEYYDVSRHQVIQ